MENEKYQGPQLWYKSPGFAPNQRHNILWWGFPVAKSTLYLVKFPCQGGSLRSGRPP